ncbi:MAG: FAD-dependent oxidoreductase, partial [Phycisphaeraceae bacterium]|nr:FAD-dependent oxidoreductase [Phycisphaeraceae bacterium]
HWLCRCRDETDACEHELRARCVVNATGPWASHWQRSGLRLRPSKGAHLVVDRRHLPVDDAVVISEGKRILFVIPWGERLILGTTDTDYTGSLEDVRAEAADVSYILHAVNTAFKGPVLNEGDIISHWAGLRPLIADSKGTPSDISRRHVILNGQPGWWDIAGGKLTTYRLIAEQALDRIVKREKLTAGPCLTAGQPLLAGGLTDTYSSILPPPLSEDSVIYYCTHEWARTLSDVMIRRTSWHHYLANQQEAARWVGHWMGSLLGWDDQERQAQYRAYRQFTSLSDAPASRAVQCESP